MNHILNRHSFTKFEQEAAHLTDEELATKLAKRTFFNKNLSNEQILDYVQAAYNILRSQNKFGENIIEIHGELMKVYIKADGTFDTAFGVFKYFVSDFR